MPLDKDLEVRSYTCRECGKLVYEDDTVWVDPTTGKADVENGHPYHVECAPPEEDPS